VFDWPAIGGICPISWLADGASWCKFN
jgi:hypothetical protein